MRVVDPDSDEARERREAMGRIGTGERAARTAARPYVLAAMLAAMALVSLALARPEWARSYAWLVAALAALPFLHTVFLGVLSDGWFAARPFGLRPVATVILATALFGVTAILTPTALAQLGPRVAGAMVGVVLAAVVIRRVLTRLGSG